MSIQQQVSRAIRILRGNRDVSARASHLVVQQDQLMTYESVLVGQAEMEKFSKSTFSERKIMSTKTSIKRIAAVAAVALTLGGFSAVSAHAAAGDGFFTPTVGVTKSSGGTATETATATAGTSNYVAFTTEVNTAPITVIATGGTITTADPLSTGSGTTSVLIGAGSSRSVTMNVATPTAGTITVKSYTFTNGTLNTTAAGTLTITVSNPAVLNVGLSTAVSIRASATTEAVSGTSDTLSASKTAATIGGEVRVTVNNASAAAYNGATVSASVAGSGLVAIDESSTQVVGTSRAASRVLDGTGAGGHSASSTNVTYVHISADGTSGTGTITISVTDTAGVTTVLATKTITFTGSVASVKAVGNLKVLKASSVANYTGAQTAAGALTIAGTVALTGTTLDSNGNPATGATVKAVSSDATVLGTGTCQAATTTTAVTGVTVAATAGVNEWSCPVYGVVGAASGKSATVTFEAYNSTTAAYDILATPVTFTIGGAIAKVVLSTDLASYTPLAPVVITVTATDSAGNPAYDKDSAGLIASPVSSIQLGGTSLTDATSGISAATTLVGGVAKFTGFYAPSAEGNFTISGTNTLATLDAVSVTSAVGASAASNAAQAAVDAANEATDAANAATDAANNAMDSADAAQQAALDAGDKADAALAAVTDLASKVADIATQISALSSLVSKIAASVAKISAKVKA